MSDEEKVDGEKYKERGKDLNSAGDHPKWLRECGPRRSRAPKGRELDPPWDNTPGHLDIQGFTNSSWQKLHFQR